MYPEFLNGEEVENSSGFSLSTDQHSEVIYRRNQLLDIRLSGLGLRLKMEILELRCFNTSKNEKGK